jgi:O-antigen/teichoic acid export membrane protein
VSLKRNFSVGLFSSIWSALLGLAVVPFYLKYLGTESYGLIGFFATTQALLQLLDLGLSPTINREVARASATGNMAEARNLLHTLSVVYWAMAAIIALLIVILAPIIANHWLQSRHLPRDTVTHALMLMGMVIACRWPVGLYMGALMGMQRIALSSVIVTIFGTLSSLGTVAVLVFVSPTIKVFFIWQACVGLTYAVVMHLVAWRIVGRKSELCRFSFNDLKRIWRFSAGMSALAVAGAILMQLDKVLLSSKLSLEDFGRYSLAWVIANSLHVLLLPIFNAIYPRFTSLIAVGDTETLSNLYRIGTRLLSSILFPIAILAGIFAEDLVFLWTRNANLAIEVAPIAHLLLIGTAVNGIMIFPYALQLAYGAVRLPLKICLILIVGTIPMTIFLAAKYGVIGGAFSWVIMNGIYLLLGSWLTHRVMLKGVGFKWLVWDVTVPIIFSLLILSVVGAKVHDLGLSHVINIVIAMAIGLLAIFVLVLSSPRVVRALLTSFKEREFVLKTILIGRYF